MKSIIKFKLLIMTLLIGIGSVNAQKKVKKFSAIYTINAPADKVWAVVGEDYGGVAKSHPKIVSSNYISGTLKGGEGAERVCNFNKKGTRYLREKQLDYDPANYTFRNQVFQAGKFPVNPEYTYAIYKIEPIDDESCRFVFDMTYRTKPAFMGGMMKKQFKKLINDYAIAIEHHVLTGEVVTKDNFKAVKKKYKNAR